ncbi:MAG: hypothetical protein ACD_56C00110G0003 [uncultured bacterium]|nr:MAG: hypothetical protein ACD_56C00110G0003 [uncultured bacterium]
MTTINLYQNQEDAQKKLSSRTANGGFFFSLSILVLTVAGLFGLKFYIASIVKQNQVLAESVTKQNESLAGVNSLQRILDMQARLSEIKKNLEIKDGKVQQLKMTEVLDSLGKNMSSGVVVTSYSYSGEDGKVNVSFESKNFNDAARQILNFKKSEYFSGASLSGISRAEEGVTATMVMNIGS